MRITVSFTSYPSRINSVHKVVESLYRQTVQADEIVLYLSLNEFPNAESDIPETLRCLINQKGFKIAWVYGNLKSHKKYYYALREYRDTVVITVDDDKIYAETMIADLIKSYRRFPNAVSARNVRIIFKNVETLEPYSKWKNGKYLAEYADVPRTDLCAIGAGGICYPPTLVNEDWFQEKIMLKAASEHDDLWLKYNEIINNIPVVYVKPSQEDITIENSLTCRLADNNLYGNGNDECISKLVALLKEWDAAWYQKWFQNLMTREEYIIEKKRYYAEVFSGAFDKVGNVPIYFYGAGKTARRILMILSDLGLLRRITAIIVSEKSGNPSSLYSLQVRSLSELDLNNEFGVIWGVNETNKKEVVDRLTDYNYKNIDLDMRIIKRYSADL